jgi:Flp pilus assembly protein TadG
LIRPFRLRRARRDRSRGQALVEFAFVFPIFFLLFIAMIDLGLAVFSYNSLTNAAREGARLAIVNQDTPTVITRAKNAVSIAEINDPSVTVNYYNQNDDGTPNIASPCTAPVAVGCLAVVSFQATYHPITPIVGAIVFRNGVTFTAKAVLSVEFACPNLPGWSEAQCPKQP